MDIKGLLTNPMFLATAGGLLGRYYLGKKVGIKSTWVSSLLFAGAGYGIGHLAQRTMAPPTPPTPQVAQTDQDALDQHIDGDMLSLQFGGMPSRQGAPRGLPAHAAEPPVEVAGEGVFAGSDGTFGGSYTHSQEADINELEEALKRSGGEGRN
jgi:hypothetical protein